jgi:hypothetical protein
MSYAHAAAAYQRNAVLTASPEKIVKMLYDGAIKNLERCRESLAATLRERRAAFLARNRERNPLNNVELYFVALATALAAYALRFALDLLCSPWAAACRAAASFLGFVYSAIAIVGREVVSGAANGEVVCWDFASGTPLRTHQVHEPGRAVRCLQFDAVKVACAPAPPTIKPPFSTNSRMVFW